jgi:hypothetical protein
MPTRIHSAAAPVRVASVVEPESRTVRTSTSAVNSGPDAATSRPSAPMIADLPLVATCTTVRACSTARIRLMASCWYVSALWP